MKFQKNSKYGFWDTCCVKICITKVTNKGDMKMKHEKSYGIMEIILVIFFAVFALPFVGGYLMLDSDRETKVMGGILFVIGLVIWFLYGIQ